MSVSLLEVIASAGYDITTKADAEWFIGTYDEYMNLIEDAEEVIEDAYEKEEAEELYGEI